MGKIMSNTFDGVLAYEDYAWLDNDLSFDAPADLLAASSGSNGISALSVPTSTNTPPVYQPSEDKSDASGNVSAAAMASGRGTVSAGKGAHIAAIGESAAPTFDDNYGRDTYLIPSDNFFSNQWHLVNTGQSGGTAAACAKVVRKQLTSVWRLAGRTECASGGVACEALLFVRLSGGGVP